MKILYNYLPVLLIIAWRCIFYIPKKKEKAAKNVKQYAQMKLKWLLFYVYLSTFQK